MASFHWWTADSQSGEGIPEQVNFISSTSYSTFKGNVTSAFNDMKQGTPFLQ